MSGQRSRTVGLTVLGVLAVLTAAVAPMPTSYAEPPAPPLFARVPAGIPSAEKALANAKDAVADDANRFGLTLALRDLSARLPEYAGAELNVAEALLARPNGGDQSVEVGTGAAWGQPEAPESPLCDDPDTPLLCVHWTAKGRHAPPLEDGPDKGSTPDQVDTTLAVMLDVWNTEVGDYGYRPPLDDNRASQDAGSGFDVYLSDIGDNGYYGYCAVDDSRTFTTYSNYDRAAYCVLDDDYSELQFPANSAIQNLKVTAAHEFFHAVQFAYDAYEDSWFMEGTAAWIEDEVYDRINDNRQFLWDSQFRQPGVSLDTGQDGTEYGAWGFFRFLSERHGHDVVRDLWTLADGSPDGPDNYSLSAVKDVLALREANLYDSYADFAGALLKPSIFFEEGQYYPSPDIQRQTLGGDRLTTGWQRTSIDHLAADFRSVRSTPAVPRRAKVRVRVDAPRRSTKPRALALVEFQSGGIRTYRVPLGRRGEGVIDLPFGRNRVNQVMVALVNASDRFTCFQGLTSYSCGGGIPLDDDRTFRIKLSIR
jgi:hypothetical protein